MAKLNREAFVFFGRFCRRTVFRSPFAISSMSMKKGLTFVHTLHGGGGGKEEEEEEEEVN